MARPRLSDLHLPRCVYHKHGAYYLVRGGKWLPLGDDIEAALLEYARICKADPGATAAKVAQRVYVISARSMVKIGIAADPKGRVSQLGTGNPDVVGRPAYMSAPLLDARSVELQAHTALAAYRVRGEWFRCSKKLAIATVKNLEILRQSNRRSYRGPDESAT